MLTRERLVELYEELQGQKVLSVYVDADQHDPAERDAWRVKLAGEVARVRRGLEESREDEVPTFERAWQVVSDRLRSADDAFLPKRGWVAFATAERLWYAEPVPARMPSHVSWQDGIRAAPYVRALKQERPVTVVLADTRRARIFEQVGGKISEGEGIQADTDMGDLSDIGIRKGSGRASGVRGETSTDQAHRILEVASERMIKELALRIDERAGADGVVVLGGPGETVSRLATQLSRRLDGRVAERQTLHLDMSASEVREEVRSAAGDLSEQLHDTRVVDVLDAARAGGRGSLGKEHTVKALDDRRVDTLLLSRSFIQEHPGLADRCVGLAFGQGADVEEVSGRAGARLDEEAHGVAARLRF